MEAPELHAVLQEFPTIRQALVIDAGVRLLFVVMGPDASLDDPLRAAIHARLRASAQRVPDAIYAVPELPRASDGKLHGAVLKSIFTGTSLENASGRDAVANPDALRCFVDLFNNL